MNHSSQRKTMNQESPQCSDERGASMVEYALLVVLIAIIAFAAVQLAGNTLSETYSDISQSLVEANGG